MKEQELIDKLRDVRKGMRLMDSMLRSPNADGEVTLTANQAEVVNSLFDLFNDVGWQLEFSNYKELVVTEKKAIDTNRLFAGFSGNLVRVRSCRKAHGDKTYLGILIGDVALSVSHTIKDGVVTAGMSNYNPGILIPELKDVVYGCESWWGVIESEEELNELITDETIANVWYVKLLKTLSGTGEESDVTKEDNQEEV